MYLNRVCGFFRWLVIHFILHYFISICPMGTAHTHYFNIIIFFCFISFLFAVASFQLFFSLFVTRYSRQYGVCRQLFSFYHVVFANNLFSASFQSLLVVVGPMFTMACRMQCETSRSEVVREMRAQSA